MKPINPLRLKETATITPGSSYQFKFGESSIEKNLSALGISADHFTDIKVIGVEIGNQSLIKGSYPAESMEWVNTQAAKEPIPPSWETWGTNSFSVRIGHIVTVTISNDSKEPWSGTVHANFTCVTIREAAELVSALEKRRTEDLDLMIRNAHTRLTNVLSNPPGE